MTYYDDRGRTIELADAGRRGGEGSVHRIRGDAVRVAKIYHAGRLTPDLHTKLRVMLDQPPNDARSSNQHRSIAWVDGLVFADRSARELRGFTMPYVDIDEFRQAHAYYDVSDRTRTFGGDFTWRHLLFAAHNLASAVAAVHAAGHRVGDLRETNLLVAPSALITLIDCDSFQIRDRRTQCVYPTRVATGDYLPPELHGVDFGRQHPDRLHGDLFALAVLVFRFLMLGVHPFQARGPGVDDAPTTEAKIRRGVFAFTGRTRGAEPPEYAPPWAVLPSSLQALFVRAFVDGHRAPEQRPVAGEWATALADEGKRLKTCGANPNHFYAHGSRSCAWCKLTSDPFPGPIVTGRQVALASAPTQIPEATRVEQVRAYTRVALADGAITDREFEYLRKAGGELGLKTAVIDRVIDDESRRSGAQHRARTPTPPPASSSVQSAPTNGAQSWNALVSTALHPSQVLTAARDRRFRARFKGAAPVLLACTLAGAFAPVIAPVALAVIGLPALAVAGEISSARRWRAYAKVPLRVAVFVHHALGHAARVFVPVALAGAAASYVPDARPDVIARVAGAIACATLVWMVMSRLSSGTGAEASALRAGRDAVWKALVGGSARTRRPAYVLWALSLAGVMVLAWDIVGGAQHVLWWPLALR